MPGSLPQGLAASLETWARAVVSSEGPSGAGSTSKLIPLSVGSSSRALSQRPPSAAGLHGPPKAGFLKPAQRESARSGIPSPLPCPAGWKQATGLATFKGKGLHVAVTPSRSGSLEASRGSTYQTPPPPVNRELYEGSCVMSVAPAPETIQALSGN